MNLINRSFRYFYSHPSTSRSHSQTLNGMEGQKVEIPTNYGGLGVRYYLITDTKLDKIQQIDTNSGLTETNGSVRGRAIILALGMRDYGIQENDIVVISSQSHGAQTIAVLATLFLGAIVAPLEPELALKDCTKMLSLLKPKMVFCDLRAISQIERVTSSLNIATKLVNFGTSYIGNSLPFNKLLTHKETDNFFPVFIRQPKKTVAFIIATQGASADMRLVCLSHNNILLQTLIFLDVFTNLQKVISYFPLSWMVETILMCVGFEANIVRILPGLFKERSACKIIHDLKIDFALLGTDLALRLVADGAVKDFDINCLKYVFIGTRTTTISDMHKFHMALPKVRFIQTYLLTETGFIAAISLRLYPKCCEKPDSVGPVLKNCKIKIVDIDTRETLGVDQIGEVVYSGDGLMLGYFKDPPGTLEAMEKGYFKTGDVAKYDEEGWLFVLGCLNDFIVKDNNRYAPHEIEDAFMINQYVQHAVVVGGGPNEIVAFVVKKPDSNLTPERLMTFVSKRLPENLCPSKIFFLDDFPKTAIGRIRRAWLRDQYFERKIAHKDSLASLAL